MGRWCALELLNLRLRKHGSNCLAALVLEAVARKTECRKSAKVQRALNTKSEQSSKHTKGTTTEAYTKTRLAYKKRANLETQQEEQ